MPRAWRDKRTSLVRLRRGRRHTACFERAQRYVPKQCLGSELLASSPSAGSRAEGVDEEKSPITYSDTPSFPLRRSQALHNFRIWYNGTPHTLPDKRKKKRKKNRERKREPALYAHDSEKDSLNHNHN